VLFSCPRFEDERADLINKMPSVNTDNLVESMCRNEDLWNAADIAITKIMTRWMINA